MIRPLTRRRQSSFSLHLINATIILSSVLFCTLMLLVRLPGMTLSGIGPNWLLIWVVAWSMRRTPWQGLLSGICLGLLQDSLTAPQPTHMVGLALVGFLVGRMNPTGLIEEDFISRALIVFGMALLVETVTALQFGLAALHPLSDVWLHLRQTALSSAILSSLWTPVIYVPLNLWWQRYHRLLGIE
ncbi:MAG: rod shape-determining protein MreD [Acaryochloridaceae cyanobacterium SU_2_1]|nr:rod shape-determining protein MreD [Acaryochloridaceae cyanobacterium SU_2_1]